MQSLNINFDNEAAVKLQIHQRAMVVKINFETITFTIEGVKEESFPNTQLRRNESSVTYPPAFFMMRMCKSFPTGVEGIQ